MKLNRLVVPIYHFLFALASSVVGAMIVSWPLLALFVLVQKTYETVKLSVAQVMANYNQLLWYLIWPFKKTLQMTNFPTSPRAAVHFAACKQLFLLAIVVFLGCFVFQWYQNHHGNKKRWALSKTTSLVLLLLPIMVLPFALSNFDAFFVAFHHLLFDNSDWLFDSVTDPIINVLTEGFFSACFAVAGIIYELYFAEKLLSR